jgi:hypothetical protein
MKKVLQLLPLLLLLVVGAVAAQTNYPLSLGPYLGLKAGVNAASIPEGSKTGVGLSGLPDFGATLYVPLGANNRIGFLADLGYSTYAYGERLVIADIEGDLYKQQVSYVTLAPSIYLSSFTLGFTFGLPVAASTVFKNATVDGETDDIATLVEIQLGGMIPVVENANGRLNILLRAGYMLTGISSESSSEYNPKAATFGLGVNYLFNLK